jgi:hypothetical protein
MKIKFENFSLFDNSNVYELSPLTFLIGGNSCGKSTFVNGLEIIGNGELQSLNQVRKGKSGIIANYEVINDLFRKQIFEIGNYSEFFISRSFIYINAEGKDILKVSPFMGNDEGENIVLYVDRLLAVIEKAGITITDDEVAKFLKRYKVIKKHLKDEKKTILEVFKPDKEIEYLEQWFFEVGLVELFELEEFGFDFQQKIIDLFITLFKPYTFYGFFEQGDSTTRIWDKSRKAASINVIKNNNISSPKRIYNSEDFIAKQLAYDLEKDHYTSSYEYYDEKFRAKWFNKFFGNEKPLKLEAFRHGVFEIMLNDRYLTEQGSGITKILQYILYFSTLTSDVINHFDEVYHTLEICKSQIERQNYLVKIRVDQSINKKQFIYIEEPEVHLHPNFQILLAEMIFELSLNSRYHFIIETHSEYVIRKMQLLMATNKLIPTQLLSIINFGSGKNHGKVQSIHIDSKGSLTKSFYPGFFDLSQDLQYQLMLCNRSNLN